jgi:predicted peptidase
MKIIPHALVAGAVAILSAVVATQLRGESPAPAGQEKHVIRREALHKIDMEFLLFLPKDYEKSTKPWPLILYLHGGTPRGEDITQMIRWGLTQKVDTDPNFPFIVVSPQCHRGEIWTDVAALAAILDEIGRNYRVDPDRVFVTGHSMGGRGALYAAYKMPERFAAVVSLAPVSPVTAWGGKLARLPLWLFHGANDQFTPLKELEELVRATETAGGHPQLTVLPERDHYILDIYDRPDLYKWLAEQKRKPPATN